MANRLTTQYVATSIRGVNDVFASVTFGASGAPTLTTGNSFIKSITRSSAGDYVISFMDAWYGTLMVKHLFANATTPAAPAMYIKADNTAAVAKTMEIVFNSAGTATDPATGEKVYLVFSFKNSSVKY